MNRKAYASILILTSLAIVFLTSCSSSNPPAPVLSIAAASGGSQSAGIGTAFANPLVATVMKGSTPVAGLTVTFTAPAAGASGTFASNSTNTETQTTDATGTATSTIFTANTVSGTYSVTASIVGASTPASFSLTNTAGAPASITATGGATQSAPINTAFGSPLAAQVLDADSNPVSGAVVTFTITPAGSGASGTFSNSTLTEMDTTDATGTATSSTVTANGTIGGPYTVAATVGGVVGEADFSLTNVMAVATTNYSYWLTGEEEINDGPNFYAVAGAVTIDANGNVIAGEQDYNDAFGLTSAAGGDAVTGGTLAVDGTTGQGTLTVITTDPNIGVGGTLTFGIQFVNASHALIMQYDGTATSSGSFDLQTLGTAPSGGFAFTMSGVNADYDPTAFGGVFTISGANLTNGLLDTNDTDIGISTATPFTGTLTAADTFGRGTITGVGISLAYYVVGPEAIRLIDIDLTDSAVGSAFGQGTNATAASNAGLGSSVFGITGNSWVFGAAAAGQFSTSNTSSDPADLSGVGDDNEVVFGVSSTSPSSIAGTYSIATNGYGSLTITPGDLGDVSALGIYMTDPNLNINDPNNTTSGLGGGLALDLDDGLAGITGTLTPQTDPAAASFTGNYGVGWQNINFFSSGCELCEFDMIAQGSSTAGALSLTGLVSDPFFTLGTPDATSSGNTYTGTPLADSSNLGRYSMTSLNTIPNPLEATIDGLSGVFDLVIYQASGDQLYWLETDSNAVFLGPLQQQGSLVGIPAAKKPAAKTQAKPKH